MIKVEIPNKYLDDTYDYLNDSNYFFNITPGEYSLDFELCEYIVENNRDDYDVQITGHLKWDGCFNWHTNPDCMYHFCGSDDAFKLAKMFKFLEDLGKQHIINWMD